MATIPAAAAAPAPAARPPRRLLALLLALLALAPHPTAAQTAVAFGDSVTKGFVPSADQNIPYTLTLERLLRKRFGGGASVRNANSGPAVLLPAPEKEAMAPGVYSTLSSGGNFRWAIFMVGTNDILMGHRSGQEVVSALRPLVDAALNRGARVFLLSMPPTSISTQKQERERQALNEAEKRLAREYRARGKPVTAVDLESGLYDRLGGGFRPNARVVLEDGVHLCRLCYEQLGRIVYRAIGAEAGWCGGGRRRGAAVLTAAEVGRMNC
jgi:lysophospholipase L1-like esterase